MIIAVRGQGCSLTGRKSIGTKQLRKSDTRLKFTVFCVNVTWHIGKIDEVNGCCQSSLCFLGNPCAFSITAPYQIILQGQRIRIYFSCFRTRNLLSIGT